MGSRRRALHSVEKVDALLGGGREVAPDGEERFGPSTLRNPPEIFWAIFTILISHSAALLSLCRIRHSDNYADLRVMPMSRGQAVPIRRPAGDSATWQAVTSPSVSCHGVSRLAWSEPMRGEVRGVGD